MNLVLHGVEDFDIVAGNRSLHECRYIHLFERQRMDEQVCAAMESAVVGWPGSGLRLYVLWGEESESFEFGDGLFGALAIVLGWSGIELVVAESFVARGLAHPGQVRHLGQ